MGSVRQRRPNRGPKRSQRRRPRPRRGRRRSRPPNARPSKARPRARPSRTSRRFRPTSAPTATSPSDPRWPRGSSPGVVVSIPSAPREAAVSNDQGRAMRPRSSANHAERSWRPRLRSPLSSTMENRVRPLRQRAMHRPRTGRSRVVRGTPTLYARRSGNRRMVLRRASLFTLACFAARRCACPTGRAPRADTRRPLAGRSVRVGRRSRPPPW